MSIRSRTFRWLLSLLAVFCYLSATGSPARAQEGGVGGDGEPLTQVASTINGVQVVFAVENGKTSIGVRVCANAPNFQVGVKQAGEPDSAVQLFSLTAVSNGCSPNTTGWWRLVFNADPGPTTWTLYGSATDAVLPLGTFVQRAARANCSITALGAGVCTPSTTPPPTSAPAGSFESPAAGASLSGTVNLGGWATDAGAWNSAGVDQVEVWVNDTRNGVAAYGQARPDVASALGDGRFTGSGYSYQLDTTKLTNGAATLQIRARSAISGQVTSYSRSVTIANSTVGVPTTQPVPPPVISNPGIWNVPYYSQGNPAWGAQRIGACANTIANVGCALTSLAMLFKYYGADQNPGTLNGCLGAQACLMSWSGSRILPCSSGKVTFAGWPKLASAAAVYARMEQELRSRPVILEIRRSNGWQHFVVVLKGSGSDPRNYIVNDPGIRNGARTTLANTLRIFPGYQPAGLRLYSGTPTVTSAELGAYDAPGPLEAPALAAGEVITGSVALDRNTETDMVLELAAQSSAGAVTAMRVWTQQSPSEIWQPLAQFVQVPIDEVYYVQFRDAAGNVTPVLSAGAPNVTVTIEQQLSVFLPALRN